MGQCNSHYTRNLARVAQIATICILVFSLCSACVLQPASAASAGAGITVAGGAIGTGGITAFGALGGALMPTLGVIGAVLLGCGIDTYVTEQSAEQGITRAKFLENSLRQWTSERGGSFDDLIGTIADAIHVSPLGQISMTAAGSALIYQFGNWLFANDMVTDAVSSGTVTIDGFPFIADSGSYYYTYYYTNTNVTEHKKIEYECSGTQPVYMVIQNNNVIFVSSASATVTRKTYENVISNPGSYTTRTLNVTMPFGGHNSYIYEDQFFNPGLGSGYTSVYDNTIPVYSGATNIYQHFKNNTVDWSGTGSGTPALPSDDMFTGTEQDWTDNRDLLRPGEDNVLVIDNSPDLIGGAAEELAAGDYVISVPDYLAALADAYEQARVAEASIPLTLTDTATGTLVDTQVVIAEPYADTYVSTDASTDHTGSGGKLVDADGMSGDDSVEALRDVSFKDFFPFCIPWDMYRVIMLLDAEPRAPVYTAEWDSQYLEEPITLNINLTPWDEVAEIWRICYRIMFICGLAIESRRIIKV